MYEKMRTVFSESSNAAIQLKRKEPKLKASEIDYQLSHVDLPKTLIQEARKLAVSCYQDWNETKKTKGFPSFKKKIAIPFNNQNWRFRFDKQFLKLEIPTLDKGNLTIDKYVPLKMNDYTLFWVNYVLTGKMDEESDYFLPSFEGISEPKKGNGQLFQKKENGIFLSLFRLNCGTKLVKKAKR